MNNKVAVSGIGIVSPFGDSREMLVHNLSAGRISREYITKVDTAAFRADTGAVVHVDPSRYLDPKGLRQLDRASKLASVASSLALQDAELDENRPSIERAVSLGCTYPTVAAQGEFDRATLVDGPDWINPSQFPYTSFNAQAGQVAIRFGAQGPNLTLPSGPTAGLDAIARGAELIECGEAHTVLAGGVGVVSLDLLIILEKKGLLGADGAGTIRALYHEQSTGLVPGEGACMVVLEPTDRLEAREGSTYGFIRGAANASVVDSEADFSRAVESSTAQSLSAGSLDPDEIDWICGGGSGYPATDMAEVEGLSTVFDGEETMLLTSLKSSLGEQMSASGAFQVASSLLSLSHGLVPALPPGERTLTGPLTLVRRPTRKVAERVLCTSLSFAGASTSIVVETAEDSKKEAAEQFE